jgi:hypothetical protein
VNKILLFLLLLTASCTTFFKNKSERVLARVYDEYLYESDLKGVVLPGTPAKDSMAIVKSYIDSWVRQELMIEQARKNLTDSQLDFSRQLEDYQNSLTIYAYENALVSQKLDTLVTENEIQEYYDQNRQNFLLKDNIVKTRYVKLPLQSAHARAIRGLMRSESQEDRNRLSDLCEKYASDYFLDDENWIYFNDLLKQIPIRSYNHEDFLKNNHDLEYTDSLFRYLVSFRDFRIRESVSPLEFEQRRVRDIILNKRKIDLISRMQQDVYQNARQKNLFEIY